ncbi:thiamine pyrophosphokinase [Plenodomus tracheiphilus IPT5]|uniref:Thiamine pyrophosphokinase n=1 Tax=Plenodomus tracheiphilus IPT5 TaxID=1408161 RepID=A0A6A7ATL1_9PLEO|nr:thiamine pyrophosphokinase [Plenodomus tracheiphilus IPT5]
MTPSDIDTFYPAKFLAESAHTEQSPSPPYLLILNQPIAHFDAFSRLWKHSSFRVCADGGANRLHDMFGGHLETLREQYLPDLIHGDLDSLRDNVREYYVSHKVPVSRDPDQYSTDFGKTMYMISSRASSTSLQDVLVLGTLGGRVDQGLGLLHEMIREETKYPQLRLWLFSESSVSFVLRKRRSIIGGLQSSQLFTENVGIVPFYGPAVITTAGLEWDVVDWDTRIGGQVSTSNHVRADQVQIDTNAPVLFTIERAALGGGERNLGD